MPTAPVDDQGTELFYEDSGPVPGSSDYTTLVLIHGVWFDGRQYIALEIFKKLLPYGPPSNVRIVRVNRKQYPGSSKFNPQDLADLSTGNIAYLERTGAELAAFLLWFILMNDIPHISQDRTKGGFVLLGWSLAGPTVLSFLAHADKVGDETIEQLEHYLRRVILHDPPYGGLGYDHVPENLPPPPKVDIAGHVSSYYDHPDVASGKSSGINFTFDPVNPSSAHIPAEELAQMYDESKLSQGEGLFLVPAMKQPLKQQTEMALFNPPTTFKKVDITYISCLKSIGLCVWAYQETSRQAKKATGGRPIRFIEVPQGNHFFHWDDPKAFWDIVNDVTST